MKKFLAGLLVLLMALPVLAQDDPAATEEATEAATAEVTPEATEMMMSMPETITLERENLFPEGIEYDHERGLFLSGSLGLGTIFQFDDAGNLEPFIEDDSLLSSIGIHIDRDRDVLWVPIVNRGGAEGEPPASVAAYDMESRERLVYANLADVAEYTGYFANDLTVDDAGNAYITNSFAPVLYRVTPDGEASVFLETEAFSGQGFNLNGIVYHPDGYLLTVKANSGELFKVPVDDPDTFNLVEMETALTGGDGMVLDENGVLYVVSGGQSSVFAVTSDDDWASAEVVETVETSQPGTTAALRDGAVYVVYARLRSMMTGASEFTIERITFENLPEMSDNE